MMDVSATNEWFEWARFISSIVTPIAVVCLGFWLGSRAQARKKLIEDVNDKIDRLTHQVNEGREECREDIRAVTVQVSSFQRDVAERYPLRGDIEGRFRDLQEEIRAVRDWRMGGSDPSRRR